MTWQDISKAPLDGTIVDLWASGTRIADCKFTMPFYHRIDKECWCEQDHGDMEGWHWSPISKRQNITHFMYLPEPPQPQD